MTTTRYDVRRPDPGALLWAITRIRTDAGLATGTQIAWTLNEDDAARIAYLLAGAELTEGHIATVTGWAADGAGPDRHIVYTTEPGTDTATETGDIESSHLVIQRSTRNGSATTIASCPTPEAAQIIARALTYHDPYALPTFTRPPVRDTLHDTALIPDQMADHARTPGPVERYADIIVGLLRSDSHPLGYILDRHISEAMGDDLAAHPDLIETTTPGDTEAGRRRVDLHPNERHTPRITSEQMTDLVGTPGTFARLEGGTLDLGGVTPDQAEAFTEEFGGTVRVDVGVVADHRTDRVLAYPWLAPGQVSHGNAGTRVAQLIGCLRVVGMIAGPPPMVLVDETTADRLMTVPDAPAHLHDATLSADADRHLRRLMLAEHVAEATEPDPLALPEWATRYASRAATILGKSPLHHEHIVVAPSPMADALGRRPDVVEITDEDDHDHGQRRFRRR